MSLTKVQFVTQGYDTIADYDEDNRWFQFLTGGIWEKDWEPGQYITTAAECYIKATTAGLEMMILGDDKIRRDSEIIGNFGLSTAMDGLEPDVQALVERKEAERAVMRASSIGVAFSEEAERRARLRPFSASSSSSSSSASSSSSFSSSSSSSSSLSSSSSSSSSSSPAVADRGAVLATRGWSPMLNDGFILGGVHKEFQFHLVLAQADQQRFAGFAVGRQPRDAWLAYFRQFPIMFWDPVKKKPRVFVREMIGLEAFGYLPDFSANGGLIFQCKDKVKASNASLRAYIDVLRSTQRQISLETEENILGIAGQILFGATNALTGANT